MTTKKKTSTASRCLAPVRSQEHDRHASLPSRSSIVRMAQMVVQWVPQAQRRPLVIKWRLIQLWRVGVGVKLSCRGWRISHGDSEKKAKRKRTGEWNGKYLPAMCDKNVPAKTLATQHVSFWMRAMLCWAVPWRIDKGPLLWKKKKKSQRSESLYGFEVQFLFNQSSAMHNKQNLSGPFLRKIWGHRLKRWV